MKIFKKVNIKDFKAWGGAIETKNKIIASGKEEMFNDLINGCCPEGITESLLNDTLWLDQRWVYKSLDIK